MKATFRILFGMMLFMVMSVASATEDLPPVKPGDVVISINGKKMKNNLIAIKTLNAMKSGTQVTMEVLRENKIQKIIYDVK